MEKKILICDCCHTPFGDKGSFNNYTTEPGQLHIKYSGTMGTLLSMFQEGNTTAQVNIRWDHVCSFCRTQIDEALWHAVYNLRERDAHPTRKASALFKKDL